MQKENIHFEHYFPTVWEKYLNNAGDKIFDKSSTDRPFEEVYEKETAKKNKYVSVVQFTDQWVQGEDIDRSFADGIKEKKDFKDYTFEKTETLDNGDVIHYYKAKKADIKKEPIKTGASAGSLIVPVIGLSSGIGVLGIASYLVKRKRNK